MLVAVTNYLIIYIQFNSIAPRDSTGIDSASGKGPDSASAQVPESATSSPYVDVGSVSSILLPETPTMG